MDTDHVIRFGWVLVAAVIMPLTRALEKPAPPRREIERCSLLLEICEPPEEFPLSFGNPKIHRVTNVLPILLEVADHNLTVIRKAVEEYMSRTNGSATEWWPRTDLGRVLANLVWNVPDHEFGYAPGAPLWPLGYDVNHKLAVVGSYPANRDGLWLGFSKLSGQYDKAYGKRDLAILSDLRWTRERIDHVLLEAMRDVPFKDGHWQLDK